MAASIASPDRASQSVRSSPIRRGMLTVPPAPGTRPIATSGSRNVASAAATTRPAKAGSSTPAPTQAPWTLAVTRSATAARAAATLRSTRMRWAVAGSGVVPNSVRSPPLQNDGPSPSSTTRRTGSAAATARPSSRASRIAAL